MTTKEQDNGNKRAEAYAKMREQVFLLQTTLKASNLGNL